MIIDIDKLNHGLSVMGAWLAYDDSQALCLCHPDFSRPLCLDIDSLYRRAHRSSGKRQLAQACLAHQQPSLIDATAGLGRDGILLAAWGCQVTLVERHPVLYVLLVNAVERWQQRYGTLAIDVKLACSIAYLHALKPTQRPAIIYLDPMHPQRQKAALVKKELRIIRALVGDDHDQRQLADEALRQATQRLVIKWPRRQPPLIRPPHHQLHGSQIRYDVYTQRDWKYEC